MNMQQMMAQAQRMQRELRKAMEALAAKEFVSNKGGLVTVTMLGNKRIKSVVFADEALDPENKEMLEASLALAVNELQDQIIKEEGDINERITGSRGGLGGF